MDLRPEIYFEELFRTAAKAGCDKGPLAATAVHEEASAVSSQFVPLASTPPDLALHFFLLLFVSSVWLLGVCSFG